MSPARITPPLKWHGGKHYLAKRIIELMPAHTHYVEPYAGGLSVLLSRSGDGVSEVVNDLNGGLANFWRVMQQGDAFAEFRRLVEATPFGSETWEDAATSLTEHGAGMGVAAWAWAFFVTCRQSLAGRMKSFTGVTKTRVRRGMNNEVSAWLTAVEGLPDVHARLRRVLILNRPALDVIRGQDGPQTLFYLDPPYLHSTRVTTSDYAHEMTAGQHAELLSALSTVAGKFLLSGYRSDYPDRDPANCRLSNLRWDTKLANANDKRKHGTMATGERNGLAKLNAERVRDIRERLSRGEPKNAIARDHRVTPRVITLIALGRTWRQVS
jgi:DNA adenine methylase